MSDPNEMTTETATETAAERGAGVLTQVPAA